MVAGASGNPVEALNQEDFSLLDNQQLQKITSFQGGKRLTAMPTQLGGGHENLKNDVPLGSNCEFSILR